MKNLKKLFRKELKKMKGGGGVVTDPISAGGCDPGHGCEHGAIWNNFRGPAHWNCCAA